MTDIAFRYTSVAAPAPCTAGALQATTPIGALPDAVATAIADLFASLSDRSGALVTWQMEDATDIPPNLDGVSTLDLDPLPGGTALSPMYAAYADTVAALAAALRETWHVAPEIFPLDDRADVEQVRRYHADLLATLGGMDPAPRGPDSGDAETELVRAAIDVLAAQANLGYWPHRHLVAWVAGAGAHVETTGVDGKVDEIRIVTTRSDLEARCRRRFADAGIEIR